MAANLFDPLAAADALEEARGAKKEPSSAEAAGLPSKRRKPTKTKEYTEADIKSDFRLFLVLMWRHLGLPDPTPLQLSMAYYLQHGPQRLIVMAFRGAAKSWITDAYLLWCLYRDPSVQVLLVSASLAHAIKHTQFVLSVLREFPLIAHLAPRMEQRQSSVAFDVNGAPTQPDASFTAKGITGQVTGGRSDIIVADDIEVSTNSRTVTMRQTIRQNVTEFENILKPNKASRIIYLGTPHDEDSLYGELQKRTYTIRIWPALFPTPEKLVNYGDRLAPFVTDGLRKDPSRAGHSTEPGRFSDQELEKRKLAEGESAFTLQYLLDTSLSNRDKYPLKLKELMILPLDIKRGPRVVTWGMGETKRHLPTMGFNGDYMHGPAWVSPETDPYSKVVAAIDPSGRGTDETAMVILAELHGVLFGLHVYASLEGYSQGTLEHMASLCVQYGVHEVYVEGNFGDGMFISLFRVVLNKAWEVAIAARKKQARSLTSHGQDLDHGGTEIVELKSSNQMRKHERILSVLEPLTQQHRLVLSEDLIMGDYESLASISGEETRHKYSLMWQYTHQTREKDGIPKDDRLETLAMACTPFAEALGVDPGGMALQRTQEALEQELEDWLDDAEQVGSTRSSPHRGQPVKTSKWRTKAAEPSRR